MDDVEASRNGPHLWRVALAVLFSGAIAEPAAAISINVNGNTAAAGDTKTIVVTLRTTGAEVVGTENHIDFAPPLHIAALPSGDPDCAVDPSIGKEATAFHFAPVGCVAGSSCTSVHAEVLSFENDNPIPDKSVLYRCRVVIAPNAAPGDYVLHNSGLGASDSHGTFLPADGTDGTISVRPAQLSIDVGNVEAGPGGDAMVDVRLNSRGAEVVGTQNRINFAPPIRIAALASGAPDCTVNAAIHKSSTAFAFLPIGCAPADCTGMGAFVLAFDNFEVIPNGSTLYTCRVHVDANANPGTYPLHNSELGGADAAGGDLIATGSDGSLTVPGGGPLVAIDIDSVRAVSNQRESFDVRLYTLDGAPTVAGTQNDIFFDPSTPIAATGDGTPDCTVNPDIHKNGTEFLFLPPDCLPGTTCAGMRAFVLAVDNTVPIPGGAMLYSCAVQVAPDAAVGVYPLRNDNAVGSDPEGDPVVVRGRDGQVEVICAGDCDGNGQVAIFELLRGVNILLGAESLSACPVFDADGSGNVTVNEIIQAVSSGLRGCNSQ
jgi:hypothetical protein